MEYSASIRGVFGPLVAVGIVAGFAHPSAPGRAVAIAPVAAIVDAFRAHRVVAVWAGHGEARGYAFGLSVIRYPRFDDLGGDLRSMGATPVLIARPPLFTKAEKISMNRLFSEAAVDGQTEEMVEILHFLGWSQ